MTIISKQAQVSEIIRCGKDPAYFMSRYLKIQHPTRGLIPFKTYKFQDECVQSFNDHRFNIILKSRQLGLSTLVAAYAIWMAVFFKEKNILVIATKLSVAQNFIKKIKVGVKNMPKWLLLPEIIGDNKQAIEFSNGSSIKAVPTSDDAGRSEALSLLIIDEAAFIRNFDEIFTGLYPTLSTGGRAIVLSTPNGVGGQYHELWVNAVSKKNEFNPVKLPWDVHPDRDDQWFENECKNLTKKQIAQELLCDFAASGDTVLNINDIEWLGANIKRPLERWGPEMDAWVWKYSLTSHQYIISADVSRGDANDCSTFHVIDTGESEVVCEFKGRTPPDQFAAVLAEAGKRYNNALICPENNTFGYAVIMKLRELGYKNLYFRNEKDKYNAMYGGEVEISKIGFSTQAQSRNQILTKLEQVIRNREIKTYSSRLYEEAKTFVWNGNKAQAHKGFNDDLIMSLAIGVWIYETSPVNSKTSYDINKAMLQGFGVNNSQDVPKNPYAGARSNPFVPISVENITGKGDKKSELADFKWLL